VKYCVAVLAWAVRGEDGQTGVLSCVRLPCAAPQVFGQTFMQSAQGTASFNDLKLRAQPGWQDVDFAASTPFQPLASTGVGPAGACEQQRLLAAQGCACLQTWQS
jgi:hypothetical protein